MGFRTRPDVLSYRVVLLALPLEMKTASWYKGLLSIVIRYLYYLHLYISYNEKTAATPLCVNPSKPKYTLSNGHRLRAGLI